MTSLRPLWLGILIAASGALTTIYTCITPFAAFAVIAAARLSRRDALLCTIAAWLANQAVGFGVLDYPWTTTSVAWGVAIGGAAGVGTLAAHWTVRRLTSLAPLGQMISGFVAAFALYELALYAVAMAILGGNGAFAPRVVGQVLLVNTVALVGLHGVGRLVSGALSLRGRHRAQASRARLA